MSQERMKILEMLGQGKITAEEAEKLIAKIESGDQVINQPQVVSEKPISTNKKFLHVQITDGPDTHVNINIPIALAKAGLSLSPVKKLDALKDKGINIDDILDLIYQGADGELVNIQDKDSTVKIFIK